MHHPTDRIAHTTAFVTPALAGTRNSSMGSPPWSIDPTTHRTMSERPYHGATSRSYAWIKTLVWPLSTYKTTFAKYHSSMSTLVCVCVCVCVWGGGFYTSLPRHLHPQATSATEQLLGEEYIYNVAILHKSFTVLPPINNDCRDRHIPRLGLGSGNLSDIAPLWQLWLCNGIGMSTARRAHYVWPVMSLVDGIASLKYWVKVNDLY